MYLVTMTNKTLTTKIFIPVAKCDYVWGWVLMTHAGPASESDVPGLPLHRASTSRGWLRNHDDEANLGALNGARSKAMLLRRNPGVQAKIARALDVSEGLVSRVWWGKATSARIMAAILKAVK